MRLPRFNSPLLSTALLTGLVLASSTVHANEWPVFGGNWNHQRHTESAQISAGNVNQLAPAWEFDTGIASSFQATPIVVDGVMYVSLPFNHVVALQADTGKQLWSFATQTGVLAAPISLASSRVTLISPDPVGGIPRMLDPVITTSVGSTTTPASRMRIAT